MCLGLGGGIDGSTAGRLQHPDSTLFTYIHTYIRTMYTPHPPTHKNTHSPLNRTI